MRHNGEMNKVECESIGRARGKSREEIQAPLERESVSLCMTAKASVMSSIGIVRGALA